MPKTCTVINNQLFNPRPTPRIQHVLQQMQSPANEAMLREWTCTSVQNIRNIFFQGRSTTELDKLVATLERAPFRVRVAVFMLLLNIDHLLKDQVIQTDNPQNTHKITRFYADLKHSAVSQFLSTDMCTLSEFVDMCEELYVIA